MSPAPATWIAADSQPLRACVLCTYGHGSGADRQCRCAAVAGRGNPVPVQVARARNGACGPEAYHLHFPGLLG